MENGGKATVQKFNGTNWEVVGTAGFSSEIQGTIALTVVSMKLILFIKEIKKQLMEHNRQ